MTIKTVLVATDLSARSDRAMARAADIARQREAQLVAIHAVDDELPAKIAERQRQEAEISIKDALSSLPGAAAREARIRIGFGEPYVVIVETAEELDIDLVVIGKPRSNTLLDLFRGSTVERVLRFGNRPVLVVKRPPKRPYERVLVGSDFSQPSRRAIEVAGTLVLDTGFQLLHAYDIPFRGLLFGGSSLDQLARRHEEQFEHVVTQEMSEFSPACPKAVRA